MMGRGKGRITERGREERWVKVKRGKKGWVERTKGEGGEEEVRGKEWRETKPQ